MTFLHPALLIGLALVAVPGGVASAPEGPAEAAAVSRAPTAATATAAKRAAATAAATVAAAAADGGCRGDRDRLARPTLPPANYTPNRFEIASLAGVFSLALAAYFAVMVWWQRQPWPRHLLNTRRTMLRGGLGLLTALLVLLAFAWPYSRRVAAEITAPAPASVGKPPRRRGVPLRHHAQHAVSV